MSSDKQIAANKLNAKQSTGPRSPAGKARVAANALKHGLTARDVVLPGENPDDFESFRADLLISLDLQGALEGALGEMIIGYLWRLRRVFTLEATLYKRGCAELLVREAEQSVSQYESTSDQRVLSALRGKKVVEAAHRQAHEDAKRTLAGARVQLDDPAFNVTRVLEGSPEPLLNLWRHEAVIARSMLRTLHELERLQAKRAGRHVSVPAVVDVDVSIAEPAGADIGGTGPNGGTNGNQQ